MEDARTTSRWYIIISMGRAAGHLALGIGKASAATLSVILEQFRGRPVTVDEICDIIIGSIIKRKAEGSNHGSVVLAEGLIEGIGEKGLLEALPEGQLQQFGKIIRDDHGHLSLGEIEFGRLMKELLAQRLERLGLKTGFIAKDLGYELRCADPIPFDAEYTRDLGYAAVKFSVARSREIRRHHQLRGRQDEPAAVREDARPQDRPHAEPQGERGRRSLRMRLRLHDPAGTRGF